MVTYNYDSNAILAQPLKSRRGAEIAKAFNLTFDTLASRGAAPNMYILDNEISGDLKHALKKHKLKFQLAPPHQH